MTDDALREQLAYYRARAPEYDASLGDEITWTPPVDALRALEPCERVLELARGTGTWTRELVRIGNSVTALDGAPEMLARNLAKVADPRVEYRRVDLFAWKPDGEYDLVFFAFWLSHVPPARLPAFLDRVTRAVQPGGRVFLVDEPVGGSGFSGPTDSDDRQVRTVEDGRQFTIVKVYYDPATIQQEFAARGFDPIEVVTGEAFFYLTGRRRDA
ncbi:MAG: class I SAM-dependent methyltransferase [Thermomicrobiales bacterium]